MAKVSLRKSWSLKQQIFTLFYAFKDAGTPWYAKLTSILSIVYLLSPADLIPDVVPLAGYIDDLFVVPFLINMSSKLLPSHVKLVAEEKARKNNKKLIAYSVIAIIVLIGLLVLLFYLGVKLFNYISS